MFCKKIIVHITISTHHSHSIIHKSKETFEEHIKIGGDGCNSQVHIDVACPTLFPLWRYIQYLKSIIILLLRTLQKLTR